METLAAVGAWAKDICSIVTLVVLLVKPIRERLFGLKAIREGQMCQLRSEIVRTYYRRHEEKQLQEYEFKNTDCCYKAYKALGGNSFIDHLHQEMQEWEII